MSDAFVFHYVHTRDGRDVERIATRTITPGAMARLIRLHGRDGVRKMVETERRQWLALVLQREGAGHEVRVVRERGFKRSVYPGAAIPPARPTAVVSVSGQKGAPA